MKASVIKGVMVGSALGVALGVGSYTFVYAKGWSYMTNNPAACVNCHFRAGTVRRLAYEQPPGGGDLQDTASRTA